MRRLKRKKQILLLLVLSLLFTGCQKEAETQEITAYAKKVQYRTDGKVGQREEACFQFVTENMMRQGGIYTRYLESKGKGKLAKGHEVLAESEGLLLRYALQRKDAKLYQEIKSYIVSVLEKKDYLSYRVNQDGTPMKVNACVDDLRIIRGLYEGGDRELALSYAQKLEKTNFKKGLLVDYYTASDKRSSHEMTLCYGDLAAMDYVAKDRKLWKEIRSNTEEVMLGGYLGDAFPFFQTRYQVKRKRYVSEDIFMTEALLTAFHLAEVGKCPQRTLEWIEESLEDGKIYGTYSLAGEPVDTTESTAIYAICVLLGQQTGNERVTALAQRCLERLQVLEESSEIYGAFGDSSTLEVYSFDNLMALMAMRTLAKEEEQQEEAEMPVDTLLISDKSERERIEPLIKSTGKRVDFAESAAYSKDLLKKYRYVVTTKEEVLAQLPEGQKVFAIGTERMPEGWGTAAYRKYAHMTFALGEFTQTAKGVERLFYTEKTDGQVFGELHMEPDKTIPYSVVDGDYAYASYAESGDLSSVALSAAFRAFFELPKTQGKSYVLLDEIYPFTEKEMLHRMGEDLHENGIPYILRVMPVYEKLDYPAFGEWAKSLLALQKKGGSVVLHEPIDTKGRDAEEKVLEAKLLTAENALEHQGINLYPMETMPVALDMEFFKTVQGKGRNFGTLPVDTVLVLPVYEEKEVWEKDLRLLQEKWLTVADYRSGFPKKQTVYEEQKQEDYAYRETQEVSMKGFFDKSNKILLTIVGIAVSIYLILLLNSRRMYRNKFKTRKK